MNVFLTNVQMYYYSKISITSLQMRVLKNYYYIEKITLWKITVILYYTNFAYLISLKMKYNLKKRNLKSKL